MESSSGSVATQAPLLNAAEMAALMKHLSQKFNVLRIMALVSYWFMALLCFALIIYLRVNRNVAFKGDNKAARKILLPSFEPLLWILGISTNVFSIGTLLAMQYGDFNSKLITESYYCVRQFVFLIVLVLMLQKSITIPAMRRTVFITTLMSTYTLPLVWLLGTYANKSTNYWGLMIGRSLILLFYTYIFIWPPGRASKRSFREYCAFAYIYYVLSTTTTALLNEPGQTDFGICMAYASVTWATFCPFFIWRVLQADTEYWRGIGRRACALQDFFRQNHTINERISSQGLHVLIEMHRKYIIDFAHLELKQRIGVGSSATVFNGILHSNIPVAVKVYTPTDFTEETVAEFSHEAALCGALNHPNIVKFYGMCVFPPTICLVSELCQGSLDDITCANSRRQHPANRQQALINIGYMIDAARAVAYFHSFTPAFLHRDIKPANFLVDADNNVKLTDFGESRSLAKIRCSHESILTMNANATMRKAIDPDDTSHSYSTDTETPSPNKLTVKGTVDYMAPEIIKGKAGFASYGEAADVYALAVTMWDILFPGAEKFPALKNNHLQVFEYIMEGNRPRMHDQSIHSSLREIIERAWHTDPRVRPSAQIIVQVLENIQEEMYATFAVEFINHVKYSMVPAKVGEVSVSSFSGAAAIIHMEEMQYVNTQAEATRLGNAFMDSGLLHHLKHGHRFKNSDAQRYFFDEACLRLYQPICVESDSQKFNGNVASVADNSGGSTRNDYHLMSRRESETSGNTESDNRGIGTSKIDFPIFECNASLCSCRRLGQRLEKPKSSRRHFRHRFKAIAEENVLTAKLLASIDSHLQVALDFDEFEIAGDDDERELF